MSSRTWRCTPTEDSHEWSGEWDVFCNDTRVGAIQSSSDNLFSGLSFTVFDAEGERVESNNIYKTTLLSDALTLLGMQPEDRLR